MPMPSGKQQEPGPFARALSAEIRATLARQYVTVKGLAQKAGLSESYLGKRLRDVAPLTLNDTEAVCTALGKDILPFIATAFEAARESGQS
jgi:transcriptional regulator with XRE-family HTH domain